KVDPSRRERESVPHGRNSGCPFLSESYRDRTSVRIPRVEQIEMMSADVRNGTIENHVAAVSCPIHATRGWRSREPNEFRGYLARDPGGVRHNPELFVESSTPLLL